MLRYALLAVFPITMCSAAPRPTIQHNPWSVLPRPRCELVIDDVIGLFPTTPSSQKRPAMDVVVRNQGKAACGTPGNGWNFVRIESFSTDASYHKVLPEGGWYPLDLHDSEQNRNVPVQPQSWPALDSLGPGQTTKLRAYSQGGYCLAADCVPDHATFHIRVRVVFVPNGGKPTLSPLLEKIWSVVSATGAQYGVQSWVHP